ncbi:CaiB/BaiF CoA transferase family protein [Azorhizobium doebereinerae]|uniref:CaiB/BaiF CoA transferase family protein n=1 Tax=Azorhizobium doebereinerae TaxID=281091 RepID=UPI000407A63C|nr:CoA transferase [Azorhizobium doebereinerae]
MKRDSLAGKTVLEIGTMLAAPFAGHVLAQMGAEVIKLESPAGDPTRSLVRGGPSGTYIAYSRGKKSLCVDLASPGGREALERLLPTVDIVLHNLAPASARRLGVTYEACARANPAVVYCHIRGYNEGPQADDLASNPIAEAATGVMDAHRVDGRPSRLGPSYHDQFAGCYAVIGILSALLDPGLGAEHRKIEVGLYETGLHVAARDYAGVQLKMHLTGRPDPEPSGEFSMPGYGAYETSDGRWIYLVMLTDRHWADFWRAVRQPVDPDYATLRSRKKQRDRVEALVREAVGRFSYANLAALLAAAGFGFTEVLPMERVLEAPQARHGHKVTRFAFQDLPFVLPDLPFEWGAATQAERPPPLLGEHTRETLAGLGFSAEACDALVASGAAVEPEPGAPVWAPIRSVEVRAQPAPA